MAPTGLTNSKEDNLGTAAGNMVGPRGAIFAVIQITFAASNQPIQFPQYLVPLGCSVSLRGDSGVGANAAIVFAAANPSALQPGGRRASITPDTEITYPVDNVGQIWAMGTAGDGLLATIRGGAIG
ncbi:MAG TPA: hypothetical protein VK574_07590 [Terracidiphilus sp.]|nr:hypothetical protein [Terracidiphilus sp.]